MSQNAKNRQKYGNIQHQGLRRREVLKILAGTAALAMPLFPGRARAFKSMVGEETPAGGADFVFAQLSYEGGNWDSSPTAWEGLRRSLESSTSIVSRKERLRVDLRDDSLFSHPFVFMSGEENFLPFTEDEILKLRKYFSIGGTMLADDAAAAPQIGFDASFRREMARIFPDNGLRRLGADHTVYKSFYLIRGMGGRRIVSPFLEGVTARGRTSVIYSPNGISAAWEKGRSGEWLHDTEPGGERQRKLAFQLGVNIIMYALCSDYKQDRIHLPFLRRKI